MTAQLLDGRKVAAALKIEMAKSVIEITNTRQYPPGLAVILVGHDPASEIYVNNKRKACEEVGIHSEAIDLPDSTSENALLSIIDELNHNKKIDGILVQLPLPGSIDSHKIINLISPAKDVDGFHPYNLGRLAQRYPLLRPCTPYGIIQLLQAYNLAVEGKSVVVVGASNIVGRPMALEFLLAGATVTICHRFTKNLEPFVRNAEIIVIATGICDLINPVWLNKNQIVIDVGIHRAANGTLRGDIDFEAAKKQVAWITPVPGGVGPMTIATLLQNTLFAAKAAEK